MSYFGGKRDGSGASVPGKIFVHFPCVNPREGETGEDGLFVCQLGLSELLKCFIMFEQLTKGYAKSPICVEFLLNYYLIKINYFFLKRNCIFSIRRKESGKNKLWVQLIP